MKMFLQLLTKSLWRRKSRVLVALAALSIGAAVMSACLGVTYDVEQKMRHELRTYGANLIVTVKGMSFTRPDWASSPAELAAQDPVLSLSKDAPTTQLVGGGVISQEELSRLKQLNVMKRAVAYAPVLYAIGIIKDTPVIVAGTDLLAIRKVNPYWRIESTKSQIPNPKSKIQNPKSQNAKHKCWLGVSVCEKLKVGDSVSIRFGEEPKAVSRRFQVTALLSTGESEDNQVVVPLEVLQEVTRQHGRAHVVLLNVEGSESEVEALAKEISSALPNLEGQPVRKVAAAQGRLVLRLKQMMLLITLAVLLGSGLCAMTTFLALVTERRQEIALMKALGASERRVVAQFLAESGLTGLLGGVMGYAIGLAFAQFIGQNVFGSPISPRLVVFAAVIGVSWLVALVAGTVPVKRALAIEPATALRGE